jgi:hypothetical protein
VQNVDSKTLGGISGWFIWILAALLLVLSGVTYRLLTSHLELIFNTPVSLPVPLSNFPKKVGNWVGKDLVIPNITMEYMEKYFTDDFLSRQYINDFDKRWANVYVVYCSSRPAGILGHQPRVCYPANGWIFESIDSVQIRSLSGRQMNCAIQRFNKSNSTHEQIVVLNFYILNGQITANESDFSNLFGRRPNIAGDPAQYVAQVQISSTLESSVLMIAKDIVDLIVNFFPDENGEVHVAEYIKLASSVDE